MKTTQKIFYKVVSKSGRHLRSASVLSGAAHSLTYKVGKWVTPKIPNSKIFVFATLHAAENFAKWANLPIFECEIKGEPIIPRVMSCDYDKTLSVTEFWSKTKNRKETDRVIAGTRYVDAVRLLQQVN